MKSFKNLMLCASCCLLMAACSTMEEEGPRETVYYDSDPQIGMEYPEMAREMSSGSVQVYSLDGPPVSIMPPASSPRGAMQGMPSGADPNVTVFPFDDELPAYAEQARPGLLPPSEPYRPLQSPFGGPIQTPAPFEPEPYSAPMPMPGTPMSDVSRIYYRHGSATINAAGKQVIEHVARKSPSAVTVDGHASARAEVSNPVERQIVNLEMSMDRAFKVSSELIRSGVPVERIETRAFGAARPAEPLPGVDQETASRRVEIHTADGAVFPMADSYPMPDAPAPIPPLARY